MRRPVGVERILFSFCSTSSFFSPDRRCRHASIRTLEERIVSLGACWAFSYQPVLKTGQLIPSAYDTFCRQHTLPAISRKNLMV